MIDYITNLIRTSLNLPDDLVMCVERAHRSLTMKPKNSTPPRSIILRFSDYRVKDTILQQAWKQREVTYQGQRIFFDQDYTADIQRKRKQVREVIKLLREKKVKAQSPFPAQLKIHLESGVKTFTTLADAALVLREMGIHVKVEERENLQKELLGNHWDTAQSSNASGLPTMTNTDLQTTVCEASRLRVGHGGLQHGGPTGDSALPLSLHPVHLGLLLQHLQKFSDDTAIVGCVSKGSDQEYRQVITDFVDWSELNHLQLNASKTKEMVIDFRRKSPQTAPVNIQGLDIEMVESYKYLGVHLNNKLDWSHNTNVLYKRGQSRLHLLRRLRSFGVCRTLLRTFYDSVVASALFYAVACWGGGSTERDRKRLNRLVRRAGSVLDCPLDSVEEVGERRMLAKLTSIMDNHSHPLHDTVGALSSSFSSRPQVVHPICSQTV
ncbi:uncharacterized protein LKV04_008968 [Tautogolabrus adspersus]